jgi:ABC-type lipoprotein export system ATPase subunit
LGNPAYSDAMGTQALKMLGIVLPLDSDIATLSGGERKAVALARAVIRSPRLMILDEPESHLDDAHRSRLIGYIRESKARLAFVAVTHNPEIIGLADEVIRIEEYA